MKNKLTTLFLCAVIVFLSGCHSRTTRNTNGTVVKDMLGREVTVPAKVDRVVGIRAGTLRLLLYMDAADMIAGIEEGDARTQRPYLTPYPDLLKLQIIGPQMGGDAELILNARPDVIFTSYSTVGEADALQKKTGIPVIALECPEMATNARDTLYASLRLIGKVLNKQQRADTLIAYMQSMISELEKRTADIPEKDKPSVSIGGVQYSGAKGITSTQPYFPPLAFINAKNVASVLEKRLISHVRGTYIDKEQLLLWNPDVIFIDETGLILSIDDLKIGKGLNELNALQTEKVFTLLPYNNYAVNYEMVLINSWYAGKILYPEMFSDIDIREKGNEISEMFFGKRVFDEWLTEHSFQAVSYRIK
jgi:iron complex transport system substrate-binding protein